MSTNNQAMDREEAEALLPWYAAALLDESEARKVAELLETDPGLARQLALIEEDRLAAISANEVLPMPAAGAGERFMARLDAEERLAHQRGGAGAATPGLMARFGGFFQSLSPRQVAFAAILLVGVVIGQAAVITGQMAGQDGTGGFRTASSEGPAAAAGPVFLVAFQPEASVAEMAGFLAAHDARIVGGPLAGGLFRIEVAAAEGESEEELLAQLREDESLVRTVLPAN
ncbi:hypothetical protein [Afifella sp. IM 167]|uniref:hypothetical protein n=1 Tax=Afifella sp. IM 167 TaxID=2033586 RepID=UPI001CCDF649|nr:hypothetical protein [Afifella sp. IM 167]MBZ8132753.1 hypothetical protein [Afifella sp. IM 167]